ncbi:acetyl-CoA hydrolase/transferase family protein [Patulibacter sp. S7RM1-6]
MAEPIELSPDGTDLGPLRPGDGVLWGQACAEPTPLVDRLLARGEELAPLRAFVGLSWRDLAPRVPEGVRVVSYGALGRLGRLPTLEVVPCHYSALPRLLARRRLPGDVVLVQVAPPDADGRCSLGVGADYLLDAIDHARVVVAEVNERCPRTVGASVPWSRLDAVLPTSRPLLEAPTVAPGATESAIAGHVAALVEDGDTIQLGVGALPEAIVRALRGHADLGVHSGMISDGILELVEAGVVTNARKPTDAGVSVTGAALGSARLFAALDGRADVRFEPASRTHDPVRLASVGPLCAVNGVVEIDLTGQANAEAVGTRRIGAVGGQVDFLRAAAATGGKPIVAVPAKRIVTRLHGPTSTARSDIDWVVTEHGARSLAGLTDEGRRAALLEIAGPERAEELLRQEHKGEEREP